MADDLYSVLGVPRDDDERTIREAYRRLVKLHHPDVSPDPSAAARFRLISYAYEILSDPESRAVYDSGLANAPAGHEAPPAAAPPPQAPPRRRRREAPAGDPGPPGMLRAAACDLVSFVLAPGAGLILLFGSVLDLNRGGEFFWNLFADLLMPDSPDGFLSGAASYLGNMLEFASLVLLSVFGTAVISADLHERAGFPEKRAERIRSRPSVLIRVFVGALIAGLDVAYVRLGWFEVPWLWLWGPGLTALLALWPRKPVRGDTWS